MGKFARMNPENKLMTSDVPEFLIEGNGGGGGGNIDGGNEASVYGGSVTIDGGDEHGD
jgi:hypothetical protein